MLNIALEFLYFSTYQRTEFIMLQDHLQAIIKNLHELEDLKGRLASKKLLCHQVFGQITSNGNSISVVQLSHFLEISQNEVSRIFRLFDSDKDGAWNYLDFYKAFFASQNKIQCQTSPYELLQKIIRLQTAGMALFDQFKNFVSLQENPFALLKQAFGQVQSVIHISTLTSFFQSKSLAKLFLKRFLQNDEYFIKEQDLPFKVHELVLSRKIKPQQKKHTVQPVNSIQGKSYSKLQRFQSCLQEILRQENQLYETFRGSKQLLHQKSTRLRQGRSLDYKYPSFQRDKIYKAEYAPRPTPKNSSRNFFQQFDSQAQKLIARINNLGQFKASPAPTQFNTHFNYSTPFWNRQLDKQGLRKQIFGISNPIDQLYRKYNYEPKHSLY